MINDPHEKFIPIEFKSKITKNKWALTPPPGCGAGGGAKLSFRIPHPPPKKSGSVNALSLVEF